MGIHPRGGMRTKTDWWNIVKSSAWSSRPLIETTILRDEKSRLEMRRLFPGERDATGEIRRNEKSSRTRFVANSATPQHA